MQRNGFSDVSNQLGRIHTRYHKFNAMLQVVDTSSNSDFNELRKGKFRGVSTRSI